MNECIVIVWNEHFSVSKSSADYVILSKKIASLLLNETMHKHGSKLLITNITVVMCIDNKCSKYVQTFRIFFLNYVNKHMTGRYMV